MIANDRAMIIEINASDYVSHICTNPHPRGTLIVTKQDYNYEILGRHSRLFECYESKDYAYMRHTVGTDFRLFQQAVLRF